MEKWNHDLDEENLKEKSSSGNKDRSKIVHAQSEFSERVKSVNLERKK